MAQSRLKRALRHLIADQLMHVTSDVQTDLGRGYTTSEQARKVIIAHGRLRDFLVARVNKMSFTELKELCHKNGLTTSLKELGYL